MVALSLSLYVLGFASDSSVRVSYESEASVTGVFLLLCVSLAQPAFGYDWRVKTYRLSESCLYFPRWPNPIRGSRSPCCSQRKVCDCLINFHARLPTEVVQRMASLLAAGWVRTSWRQAWSVVVRRSDSRHLACYRFEFRRILGGYRVRRA